ncbi:efflux RND transporter permease subunit [Tautonia plasticadhaerens]|uniref:Amidohydrolase-related domain-containing protein n=1 Tax=Tautonia plasticadhaerens TaxID=2527974 RepID=A0A518H8M5_9BACT|nr:efflux RND transporter permease subunit [Tautonia plasticadhaerens]QDV37202.1 hypothetical protein ElP_51350 [Tautonia plasticadhaerens]
MSRPPDRTRLAPLGRSLAAAAAIALGLAPALAPAQGTERRPDYEPAAYAITDATILVAPGRTVEDGTVIVRGGVIEAVGSDGEVEVPYDAESIDGEGLFIYPGFIDLYSTVGQDDSVPRSATGLSRPIPLGEFAQASTPPDNRNGLTPEFRAAGAIKLDDDLLEARRKLGITALISAPGGSIVTGQSALVSLGGLGRRESILDETVALHFDLANPRGRQYGLLDAFGIRHDEHCAGHTHPPQHEALLGLIEEAMAEAGPPDSGGFPGSLMGVIAHLRQAMLDAEHHHKAVEYSRDNGGPAPPYDPALETLHAAKSGELPTWWEADDLDSIHRVLDLAEEFGTGVVLVGGRESRDAADRLKDGGTPVVIRVDFPKAPEVPTEEEYRKKPLKERDRPLRALQQARTEWEDRVALAGTLSEAGIPIAFSSDGLSRVEEFHAKIRDAIEAGLPPEDAIEALTLGAARIAGVDDRLGTIEPGKLGHLVAFKGEFASKEAKIRYVLVDGQKFEIDQSDRSRSAGGRPGSRDGRPEVPEGRQGIVRAEWTGASPEDIDQRLLGPIEDALTAIDGVDTVGDREISEDAITVTVTIDEEADVRATWDQVRVALDDVRNQLPEDITPPELELPEPDGRPDRTAVDEEDEDDEAKDEAEAAVPDGPFIDVATEFDEDRIPTLETGGDVLIKDVTILTVTSGTIPGGSILVRDGKIAEVGEAIEAPEGVTVIEAEGMVALPGIIDTHSHMAIDGGVNEGSLSIVPEVRVKDVVTGDDVTIYQAAAGGVTAARLLHGSANTIGGQDAVIKLKYGKPARELILRDGPQGIKFALGENVTQKRSDDPDRFPFTRPGVEAVLVRAFDEARAYQEERRVYADAISRGEDVPPFRRDLRLEALADILDGEIKIHSHCYRADEILMLLRTAERYGVRVQSLQHVLEGYKVAAEIAAHGASNSTFSDWYAYKVEAYDAIPFNAALLTEAGANVCIKSDSGEEVRHLYMEAAKMVRYGGLSEEQALALVTINPARELGLDHRLGSIEVGKDADIALFDAHPLDGFARCQLTLIDGEVAFQRFSGEDGPLLRPRPGDHAAMPVASEDLRASSVDLDLNPEGVYALINATIHPVTGPAIDGGTLVIEDGVIAEVGGQETAVPEGVTTVDLGGLDVWPGMIDGGSDLGLNEIGSVSATQDARELAPYQPELRAAVALNADSILIGANRLAGVLSAFVRPTGGTISGQGALIDLDGWIWSDLVQADEFALYVNVPPAPPSNLDEILSRVPAQFADRFRERYSDRDERLDELEDSFRRATAYAKVAATAREKGGVPPVDPRLEALAPYANGEKPVVLSANGRGEILTAIELAEELGLKAIISGGTDAWMVADHLAESGIPVLVAGTHRNPGRDEPYDAAYANPARLHEAGVTFAISSTGDATDVRNLPFEAAMAAAYGLPEEEALKAVTLYPAQILGVSDSLGSIEPGKRANLVITAGHLLQPTTEVKHLFVGGRPVPPESRHTELYQRFRRRLAEVRDGISPLGLDREESRVTTAADEHEDGVLNEAGSDERSTRE